MDILIPLGKGSRWQDNELRYCLRSIEKHLKGYSNIFIVGELPKWIKGVIHIAASDQPEASFRDYNIFRKIIAGCEDERLSDDFLFMNDDHYLLRDYQVNRFPVFHQGSLQERISVLIPDIPYRKVLVNTEKLLCGFGDTGLDYDLHCPIIYNKSLFRSSMPKEWPTYGYAIKSTYCNINKVSGMRYTDLKIRQVMTEEQIEKLIQDRPFFSIGDKCLYGQMFQMLEKLYPIKSKYE